jgi:hypothetical protein
MTLSIVAVSVERAYVTTVAVDGAMVGMLDVSQEPFQPQLTGGRG